jgi:hypothetical protein
MVWLFLTGVKERLAKTGGKRRRQSPRELPFVSDCN